MSTDHVLQSVHPEIAQPIRAKHRITASPDLIAGIDICRWLGISDETWRRWRKADPACPRPVAGLSGRPRWRVADIDRFITGSRFLASVRRGSQ
jgi:hypothetical protein